jgi:hypothetical protein
MPDPRDSDAPGIEMRARLSRPPTGHVVRRHGTRGDVWYAKYRLPDGRQMLRKIGPCVDRAPTPRAELLQQALGRRLAVEAAGRSSPRRASGMVQTGATFARSRGKALKKR